MAAIAERTENDSSYFGHLRKAPADTRMSIAAATAHAAATTAADIKADAVVTVSKSGETARLFEQGAARYPHHCLRDGRGCAAASGALVGCYPTHDAPMPTTPTN